MKFEEALKLLREGKYVRQKDWTKGYYIKWINRPWFKISFFWEDETPYIIKDDDFEENFNAEWEEYKE